MSVLRRTTLLGAAAAASHRHLKLPEKVPVHAGELVDAGGAGEGPEAGQVDAIGADGVRAAAAVEGLPVEVLLDGLGEGESGGALSSSLSASRSGARTDVESMRQSSRFEDPFG